MDPVDAIDGISVTCPRSRGGRSSTEGGDAGSPPKRPVWGPDHTVGDHEQWVVDVSWSVAPPLSWSAASGGVWTKEIHATWRRTDSSASRTERSRPPP